MPHAERAPRVAFQGEAGAYGEDAIVQRWGDDARTLPTRTFTDALARVAAGDADCAVIPVWNSAVGDVDSAVAALDDEADRLVIVEQLLVPVRHCLMALPGTALDDVRHVASHPVAIRQCSRFFAEYPSAVAREAYDTGGAARELAQYASYQGSRGWSECPPWYDDIHDVPAHRLAVIASARAAARHGLQLLLCDIQNDPRNATCFVIVRPIGIDRW